MRVELNINELLKIKTTSTTLVISMDAQENIHIETYAKFGHERYILDSSPASDGSLIKKQPANC